VRWGRQNSPFSVSSFRRFLLAWLIAVLSVGVQATPDSSVSDEQAESTRLERRHAANLDRVGEVDPNSYPQVPLDLRTKYRSLFNEALWLKAGGFFQADAMGDFGTIGSPLVLTPSKLGVPGASTPTSGYVPLGSDARLSFRRTRLFLDAYSPYPRIRHGVRAYAELDFNGKDGAVNIRHLFIALPYLVLGRTNSAFKDPAAEPESIDTGGPNAKFGLRQDGIRIVVPFKNSAFSLAWEDPGPGLSPQGTDLTDDGLKRKRDLVAHIRHHADWGHLQLSAVRRDLNLADSAQPAFTVDTVTGWGAALSGQFYVKDKDNLIFAVSGGPGLGRYINDLAGTSSELGVSSGGQVQAQFGWGGYVGYQHWLNQQTRLNTYLSVAGVNLLAGQPATSYARGYKGSINLMHDLSKDLRVGAEYEHGFRVSHDGTTVNGGRLEFSARYGF
jgi:hypothetical protein